MTSKNTIQTPANTSYVLNPTNGNVNVMASKKKEEQKEKSGKAVAGFAKNLRYSINSNGGGYTGL